MDVRTIERTMAPTHPINVNRGGPSALLIDPQKILNNQRSLNMLTIRPLVWIAVLMLVAPAWAQNVENGIGTDDVEALAATPTGMNFDPPCAFSETLPLMAAPYMDPSTQSHFMDGEGAVLNQCSNFGVSGFSAPNFLAWNCNARNLDGTRPILPAEIRFLTPMSSVSLKVGSSTSAGSTIRLQVFDAARNLIGSNNFSLTAAMQTLAVAASGIRYAVLSGACVVVADDLAYVP